MMGKRKWLCLALLSPFAPLLGQKLEIKNDLGPNCLSTPLEITSESTASTPLSVVKGGAFTPSSATGYTVEATGEWEPATDTGLEFRVNNSDTRGGSFSIFSSKLEDYDKNSLVLYADNSKLHTYRIAVQGLSVYYYRDGVYIAKGTLGQVLNASVGSSLGSELLSYGTFESCTLGAAPTSDWGSVPTGKIGVPYTSRVGNEGWAAHGTQFFFLRMRDNDASLSCDAIYAQLNALKAGATYQLSFNYKGHKDFPGTILVKTMLDYTQYADDSYALGEVVTMQAEPTGTSGTTSATQTATATFAMPADATSCYLVFVKNGNANMYIDDLSLKEVTYTGNIEPEIAIGRQHNDGSSLKLTSVTYDLSGAYAPEDPNSDCLNDEGNLISDPGFDRGMNGVDQGYRTQNTIYEASGLAGIVQEGAYCGPNMGYVAGSGQGVIRTQISGLQTFHKYVFKAAVKGAGALLTARTGSLSETATATAGWSEVELPFTTGGTTTAELSFAAAAALQAYTDNWQLYDLGPGESLTEGTLTPSFVNEAEMMKSMLQMVADHMTYAKRIYTDAGTNSQGAPIGYFKANSAGQNNEDGVRTNADYAFICAFLYTHGQEAVLPSGITREHVKEMAIKAINWAYSTHRSLKLKATTNNGYWGSADKDAGSSTGGYTWESSLWAQSVAYAYWFLKDELTAQQKQNLKTMICAEANYQLVRDIPWGYTDDTKAEENGWDTNILACAASLYPDEPNADAWFLKCRQFAMNTYSINQDREDNSLRDGKRVRDWYVGTNLWDDYTLQNHAFFHTSYQNIAIQELSESYLSFQAMQEDNDQALRKFPLSQTLQHNVQPMFDNVLKYLALADGELAMPNGNDWSMFLYDQMASYSAMACIYRDPDALMLENMAFKYTRARQQTTSDGSWMLNSDIGPRRMGVTGRRVVMAYLYHYYFPTSNLQPSQWQEFSSRHEATRFFPFVNVIRGNSSDRFTSFSWAASKQSYTGMIGTSSPDKNKIFIPFRKGNMGNFTGYFEVSGKNTTSTPSVNNHYGMYPKSYTLNGMLKMNSNSLNQHFTLYSTPGNAVIYLYGLQGATTGTLTKEGGGLMAVSTDPFTKQMRTLYHEDGSFSSDGSTFTTFTSDWVNIDNEVGVVAKNDNLMAFGERSLVNSVYTSVLYPSYSTTSRQFASLGRIPSRNVVYYSNVSKETTAQLAAQLQVLSLPSGWGGVIAPDPDGTNYLLVTDFNNSSSLQAKAAVSEITCAEGAPVFTQTTEITDSKSAATFYCPQNFSIANVLKVFVKAAELNAVQADGTAEAVYLKNDLSDPQTAVVTILHHRTKTTGTVVIPASSSVFVQVENGELVSSGAEFPGSYRNIAEGKHAYANSQLPANLPFNTIDADPDTYWQSVSDPALGREHLTLRLRNQYEINKVIVTPRAGFAPQEVEIQTSNTDGSFLTKTKATLLNTDTPQVIEIAPVKARFIRVKVISGYASQCAVREIQVMGAPTTTH